MSNPVKYDGGMDFKVDQGAADQIKAKMPTNWQMVQSAKEMQSSLNDPVVEGNLKKFIAATEKDPVKAQETLNSIKKTAAEITENAQIGSKESIGKAMEAQQEINKGPVGKMIVKFENLSPEVRASANAEPFKKLSNASATFSETALDTYQKTPSIQTDGGKSGPPVLNSMGAQKQAADLSLAAEKRKVVEQKLGML